MSTITVLRGDELRSIPAQPGEALLSALQRAGLHEPEAPCGGNGTCGKCLVEAWGALEPPSPAEARLLPPGGGRRLACRARVAGDCSVRLSAVEGARVALDGGPLPYPPDPGREGLGAAIDVGTTTVACSLYDLGTGERLGALGELNAQRAFGADVISRIARCTGSPDGLALLTAAIREQLAGALARLCREAGRRTEEIQCIAAAGNTVMEHLLAGLSPASIAAAPFTPLSRFGCSLPAADLGLPAAAGAQVYLAPAVAGYVGGDITAGLLASGACRAQRPVLFLDVGTNGEMAVGGRDGFLCCATAAGPAFEGAEISCGMSGTAGAVSRVWPEGETLRYTVIGGGAAAGICGSGLVDLLAVLLEWGAVDETGRLLPPGEAPAALRPYLEPSEDGGCAFRLFPSGPLLTAGDVRKLQLAKAAVAAGVRTLLDEAGLRAEEISALCLAGGFGGALHRESAAAIGLLPPALLPRTVCVGNSAAAGAAAVLLSGAARRELEALRARCHYLELSTCPAFSEHYIDCMSFG
ncbi:hypothetical protein CE91St41_15350 [Oscillospiraceae bacterium]|nr:hypothetical protein CE91St40_22190 [Oscillospiraceae bacterium]BDF74646.1 hypothetical protein CE91St41_15350 [Oscillospiraceae bacterium]